MFGLLALLRFKWTYLVFGAGMVVIGSIGFLAAHPAAPVQVDGTISDYTEYTRNNVYDRNELKLAGDSATYTLDKRKFHPALPESMYRDGKVNLWVDSGSTTVIAMTLYDANDQNPQKYTTDHYDNPASERSDSQYAGLVTLAAGVISVGIFATWFVLGRRRRPAAARAASALVAPVTPGTVSPDGKWYWDGVRWVAREASTIP